MSKVIVVEVKEDSLGEFPVITKHPSQYLADEYLKSKGYVKKTEKAWEKLYINDKDFAVFFHPDNSPFNHYKSDRYGETHTDFWRSSND